MSPSDSRKQILFLIPSLAGGGAERVIVTLLQHLDRSLFGLTLAVVNMHGATFRADVPSDVELVDLDRRRVRKALPKILELIWNRKPDVVFSTLGHLNLAIAALRPLLPRRSRFVARESNVPSHQLNDQPNPAVWRWLYRRLCGANDIVVCQSQTMLDDLVDHFGLPPAHGIVIRNPVDVDRIRRMAAETPAVEESRRPGMLHLVAAGRLAPQKGFDLLIEAMSLLADAPVHLTLLGEGPLRGELTALVQRHGLQERVRMKGFQANPYAWFAQADGFVLSSRYEGLPNVVLEAMACGTPVISTPAAGVATEILKDRPECVLATETSAPAIAQAIRRWVEQGPRPVPDSALDPYRVERIAIEYQNLLRSL